MANSSCCNPYSYVSYNSFSISHLAQIETYLGSPEQVYQDSYNMGFPQVIAFSTAVVGVLIVAMIVKSLRG